MDKEREIQVSKRWRWLCRDMQPLGVHRAWAFTLCEPFPLPPSSHLSQRNVAAGGGVGRRGQAATSASSSTGTCTARLCLCMCLLCSSERGSRGRGE